MIELGEGSNINNEKKVPPSLPHTLPVGDARLELNNNTIPPPSYYPNMNVRTNIIDIKQKIRLSLLFILF